MRGGSKDRAFKMRVRECRRAEADDEGSGSEGEGVRAETGDEGECEG